MIRRIMLITMSIFNLTVSNAMITSDVPELEIINPFFPHEESITIIKNVMDTIEEKKLDYEDYSGRRGQIWSDLLISTSNSLIVKEYATQKIAQINGKAVAHCPESLRSYPQAETVVCQHILPPMLTIMKKWTLLPKHVYAQIFFQRCVTSDVMD